MTRYERIYGDILEKVQEIKENEESYANDSIAFGHMILQMKFDLTDEEIGEMITDGYNDNGIDAVYFDKYGDEKTAHFFQFKFPSSKENIDKGVAQDEILKLFNGFRAFVGNDEEFNGLEWNDILIEKREEYKEYDIYNFKVWIVRFTTQELRASDMGLIKNKISEYKKITGNALSFDPLFVDDIVAIYEKNAKIVWPSFKLPYKKNLSPFSDDKSTISSAYVSVRSIYETFLPIQETIYEGNVRYLNLGSKINEGIKLTLSNEPENFHLLNNGVTIVCSKCKDNTALEFLDIISGSIINGAQTVGTIIRFLNEKTEEERQKYSNSFVNVKIVEFSSENELLNTMVYTLNTQNPMKSSYLISNDTIVKGVQEKVNRNTPYFLEIKSNEFNFERNRTPGFNKMLKNKIDIETFLQAFVAFYDINRKAHLAKNSRSSLFTEDNIEKIITELKFEEALLSYDTFLKLMQIIKEYRAYRKNTQKKDILNTLEISETEIDQYRYLNTGNFIILFALGCKYRKLEVNPVENMVSIIKEIKNFFLNKSNLSAATKSKESFDSIRKLINKNSNQKQTNK